MSLAIHVLGNPRVEWDGELRPAPRGRKAWGLLAYLLCGAARPSRQHLTGLLFAEADDPLGSLRWNFAQLRRLLGPEVLQKRSVELELPAGSFVDVHRLVDAPPLEAVAVPGIGRELLEDMDFGSNPVFESWLLLERRGLIGAAEAALRDATLRLLATGDPARAGRLGARLVALNPYDENFQQLLIRCYAESGDQDAAARQLQSCVALFRRELAREPTSAVFRAALPPAATPPTGPRGRHAARARLDAGCSAVDAGALESGLRTLALAAREAHACDDATLEGQAQLALGTALVHSARDVNEEGARALARAAELSIAVGDRAVGAAAMRELAYIDVLQGRFARCALRLGQAAALADTDEERAGVEGLLGLAAIDIGRHELGIAHVSRSIELAERSGSPKQLVFSLGLLGRSRLMREEWDEAADILERAVSLARREWTTYVPWVASLLAQVELGTGSADSASARLEHAYALGCQLGDACSEGLACHGLGLVTAARGEKEEAVTQLETALRRVSEAADVYVWLEAYILDSLCEVAAEGPPGRLEEWNSALTELAARTGMREWNVRACLRRVAAGDLRAADTARLLLGSVENPSLGDRVEAAAARAPA